MERRSIKTIRNQVYEILKEAICAGRFAPGQWLQENELAEKLCVSRSPIREALRQLAADGLVVEIPNKGVFVKEFTRKDIAEIYDLRVLLENYAIDKLHDNIAPDKAERLMDCLSRMERVHAENDLQAYITIDTELHNLLVELCGNSLLESMYAKIYSLMQQFRIYSLTSVQRFDESLVEHRDLIHARVGKRARRGEHFLFLPSKRPLTLHDAVVRVFDLVKLLFTALEVIEHLADRRAVLFLEAVELVGTALHRVELLR